jgi:hypothetical protein
VTAKTRATSFPIHVDLPANGFTRLILDMGVIVSAMVQLDVTAPTGTIFDWDDVEDPIKGVPREAGALAICSRLAPI